MTAQYLEQPNTRFSKRLFSRLFSKHYNQDSERQERFNLFSKYERPSSRPIIDHQIFLQKHFLRVSAEKRKVEHEKRVLQKRARSENFLEKRLANFLHQETLDPDLARALLTLRAIDEELSTIRYEIAKLRLV